LAETIIITVPRPSRQPSSRRMKNRVVLFDDLRYFAWRLRLLAAPRVRSACTFGDQSATLHPRR
jgi:hypothetical protein